MPQEYNATDSRTGLHLTIRGEFPSDPDERVRIARTANLFTRLFSTILATESDPERHERFRAIETQLEVADALIRGDVREVQRLMRDTLRQVGVSDEQLAQVEQELRRQLEAFGAEVPGELRKMLFPDEDVELGEADDREEPDRGDPNP